MVATGLAFGCGSDRGDRNDTGIASISASADDGGSGDDGLKLDALMGSTSTPDDGGDCAEVVDMSGVGNQPADIIFIVDNSGSMSMEAGFVQANMNAFSSQIILANIDAHVVLVSAYPPDDDAGICVDQPLGAGGCPVTDNNPPTFTHINDGVSSSNALEKIIQHFDAYKSVLRQTASKHLVVVSDDDSDLSAADFIQMWTVLDINNLPFTFHAIVADQDPGTSCFTMGPCCLTSASRGQEYIDLINQTGGVYGNLCLQDFQPVFDEVATEVIAGSTLACEFAIPPPPDGEEFNKDKVNVSFDDGAGGTLDIGRVDDPAECANVTHGWFYDDPAAPMTIVLCPQTCDAIQGFANASIAVKFGCATVPAG